MRAPKPTLICATTDDFFDIQGSWDAWRQAKRVYARLGLPERVDLVEAAFVEGFTVASDPTSFLRLARVPFEAKDGEGRRLVLLRVEVEAATDVGGVMPHLGGTSFRYDPLPAKMASRRRSLRFIYFDGQALAPLTLADVRGLAEA